MALMHVYVKYVLLEECLCYIWCYYYWLIWHFRIIQFQ